MSSRCRHVLALALAAPVLASCGSPSDSDKITAILRDVAQHPADLCTRFATPPLLVEAGGLASCQHAAAARDAVDRNLKVLRVRVSGVNATAQVRGAGGNNTIGLVKIGPDWKVSRAG